MAARGLASTARSAKLLSPAKRRRAVDAAGDALDRDLVSERRACKVLEQSRSTQRRKDYVAGDEPR